MADAVNKRQDYKVRYSVLLEQSSRTDKNTCKNCSGFAENFTNELRIFRQRGFNRSDTCLRRARKHNVRATLLVLDNVVGHSVQHDCEKRCQWSDSRHRRNRKLDTMPARAQNENPKIMTLRVDIAVYD